MIRRADGTFVLPLEAPTFTDSLPLLTAYIENIWSGPDGKSVKVEWRRNSEWATQLFRFLFRTEVGERAYVLRSQKTINLFPSSTSKTVAHEIGHVMGFRDNYFTVWDDQNCHYTVQSREADLMSNSTLGSVLPEHWEKLEQEYPISNPAP